MSYAGPVAVVFHVWLFKGYFESGKATPDPVHFVALDNHGVARYITEAQSRTLDASLAVAVVLLVVFFAMLVARLRKNSAVPSG
jgi:hypothetical protein